MEKKFFCSTVKCFKGFWASYVSQNIFELSIISIIVMLLFADLHFIFLLCDSSSSDNLFYSDYSFNLSDMLANYYSGKSFGNSSICAYSVPVELLAQLPVLFTHGMDSVQEERSSAKNGKLSDDSDTRWWRNRLTRWKK